MPASAISESESEWSQPPSNKSKLQELEPEEKEDIEVSCSMYVYEVLAEVVVIMRTVWQS